MLAHLVASAARNAAAVLAAGVFSGLVLPDAATALRPLLTPAVWGLLVLAGLRVDWAKVTEHRRQPLRIAAAMVWLLLLSPLAMAGIAGALGLPAGLAAALVLMAAAPPIISSPAFAVLIGLDAPLALMVMAVATVLTPLLLPLIAVNIIGLPLTTDTVTLALHLAGFIISALLAAAVVVRLIGRERLARGAATIDFASVVLLLAFAVAIMDGLTARLIAAPLQLLIVLAIAFAANAVLQAAGTLIFARLGRRAALTCGFLTGNRNMALLLAVLPAGTDPDVLLYFAVGQIPIYMLPLFMARLYRRWLMRTGGGAGGGDVEVDPGRSGGGAAGGRNSSRQR